jgi:hypothetical protein
MLYQLSYSRNMSDPQPGIPKRRGYQPGYSRRSRATAKIRISARRHNARFP